VDERTNRASDGGDRVEITNDDDVRIRTNSRAGALAATTPTVSRELTCCLHCGAS
jgi:hypothetical protein